MQALIVPSQGYIAVDGKGYGGFDLSQLSGIHAVSWNGTKGEVELADAEGRITENKVLDSVDEFKSYIDAWETYHAAQQPTAQPLAIRKLQANMQVDAEHQQILLQLTGFPTEAERNTWAGKVELARLILAGASISPDHTAFLNARGLATPEAKTAYANEVMGNSTKYWALVGLADRVRSEAKARINAAQTEEAYTQAGIANRASRDAAIKLALSF